MTTPAATADPTQRFFDLASSGRPRPAIDFALELTTAGLELDQLVTEILAPMQLRVGRLWQAGEWTAAQEHAATAVVDGVLGAVGLHTPPATPNLGSVLVACVEGEYHAGPARMGVERLRASGWDVTFLGASLPAQDLQAFAARTDPDVVVLSCTMPLFLPGAGRGIAAVADLGGRVVAAGAGFGDTSRRADRLGASGWIGPGADPSAVLRGPLRPAEATYVPDATALLLELHVEELTAACLAELAVRLPAMSSLSRPQAIQVTTHVRHLLRHLGLAHDLAEPGLFDEHVRWLAELLGHRGVSTAVLAAAVDVVVAQVGRAGFPEEAALCATAHHVLD